MPACAASPGLICVCRNVRTRLVFQLIFLPAEAAYAGYVSVTSAVAVESRYRAATAMDDTLDAIVASVRFIFSARSGSMERNSGTSSSLGHRATYLAVAAGIALLCFGPLTQAFTERTSDVGSSMSFHAPGPSAVKGAAGKRPASKRKKLRQPLVLNPPRLTLEASPWRPSFGTSIPNFSQPIQRGGRDFREAPDLATDLSMFRFHLNPEWRLEWDFNRHALPSERQTLGLNIGLYHDF